MATQSRMELFGKTDLSTIELPDSLEFTVVHKQGSIEVIITPVVTALVMWLFWRSGSQLTKIMAALAGVSGAIAMIANRRQGDEVSLRVTADELVTQGNMGKLFETEQRIATRDVLGMSYRTGGENEMSGLYVKLRWSERCILPRLSEEQAQQTIEIISKKFPDLATSDSAFSSFGADKIIQLGLSDSAKCQEDRQS
jgi:hypothetical protein